jgi:hypothetical protein
MEGERTRTERWWWWWRRPELRFGGRAGDGERSGALEREATIRGARVLASLLLLQQHQHSALRQNTSHL